MIVKKGIGLVEEKNAKVKLVGPKTAFLIQGDDRTGAVADTVAKQSGAGISITGASCYCSGSWPLRGDSLGKAQ